MLPFIYKSLFVLSTLNAFYALAASHIRSGGGGRVKLNEIEILCSLSLLSPSGCDSCPKSRGVCDVCRFKQIIYKS